MNTILSKQQAVEQYWPEIEKLITREGDEVIAAVAQVAKLCEEGGRNV